MTKAANYLIGIDVTSSRDTLWCRQRIYNDRVLSDVQKCTDLKEQCVDLPNTADFCADQNYSCGEEWGGTKQWDTVEDCESDMNDIVTGDLRSDTTQDTLACRLHYLRLAHASEQAAKENCPKITKNSTVCKQQIMSLSDNSHNTIIYIVVGSVLGALFLFTIKDQ